MINLRSTISILEDDPDIGFVLNFFLTEEGYKITVYSTLTAFSHAFQQRLPDLILMDVNLPDGNGVTICNQIKNNGSTKHLPILLISANSTAKKWAAYLVQIVSSPSHSIWMNYFPELNSISLLPHNFY